MKILKFSAAWCGPCKSMSATLSNMSLEQEVEEVDVDERNEVAVEYAIRGVPTLVAVDDSGVEVSRIVGSKTEGEIRTWVNKLAA